MRTHLALILLALSLSILTGAAVCAPPPGAAPNPAPDPATARAWPASVFAPYMYDGASGSFKLTECDDATGLKHYTLVFIIARQHGSGNDITYHNQPAWDGRVPMENNLYLDQIEALRARGGDVIVSFGGEGGRELANVEEDHAALEKTYQSIIDRYQLTWLDFDIEGGNLSKNPKASERRNAVLAAIQKNNPNLRISFTLPVDPNGITKPSQDLLGDAMARGLKVHSVNLMFMFFGPQFINKCKSEGELGIESANKAHEQIQAIDPAIQIGLCPCLGRNGSKDEVFTIEDARSLKAFADKTPWVCSLHFWTINDDSRRHESAFTKVFQPFTTR